MGKNARIRKLRREARRRLGSAPKGDLAKVYQQKNPDSIVLCGGTAEKMSEVLEDFAEPLLRVADSPEDTQKALLLASTAWNYALLDDAGEGEPEGLDTLLADPAAHQVFEFLVARKRALYPDNRRAILDLELLPNGREFQLNVISTLAQCQNPDGPLTPS